MYKILTVIYLFLSLLISPAWAGSQESANRFRTDFQDYLLTLKSSGVNRVSGVSIETIQARVAQVKIECPPTAR